tara:strand:- start:1307 stop:1825 length:519 start_codon:yes stop_codon:yes gene_type:complete
MKSWDVKISNVLKDVVIFTPSVHYDVRGEIFSTFRENVFNKYITNPFVEDKISVSRKNVLRGLHGDSVTDKLVQCIEGDIYLVVVDWRKDSPTYKKWDSFVLNDKNRSQVLIPSGYLNGHLCLSDKCIFSYKQTSYYTGEHTQYSVSWDDESLDIFWPIKNPILSKRDCNDK